MALRENFQNILHIETYNWRKYVLCESTLSGGLQGEGMAFRRNFLKHYTHSNMHSNKLCALWKYTEQWASSRSNGFQMKFFETLYTFKHTIEQSMLSVKVQWVVRFKQKQWVSEELLPHIIHIQIYNWTKYALCESRVSYGLQVEAMALRENFQNIIHIETYNWRKYVLCESTLSGGLQVEGMAFRRNFSKQYTHSNIQLNRVCALWKYSELWASSRSNGFKRKFSKHYTHWNIQLKKVCALWKYIEWWASSRSNGLQKKFFKNNIHIQTYNWTKYALCESTVSYGLQVEAMALREKFQNILHIETYNWRKYVLCESTLSGGLQGEGMAFRRNFLKHYTHSNMNSNKVCALWKYTEQWASSRSNGFQMKFFETLYTLKHTIEQSMLSVKVQWVVRLKQKQWVSEELLPHIIHIQTYNWTKYALCESILSSGLQAEVMAFRRNFSKQYTHSNIQLNKVCALWKYSELWASSRSNGFKRKFSKHYTHWNIQLKKVCALWKYIEWWASSRRNGFQKKLFKTIYTFKHTIEQSMRSVKVQWVMGFK